MAFSAENILLLGSVLIFAALMITRAGFKFGVPVLLLFLIVGMAFGVDGLGLQFSSYKTAQFIGTVALCVILFTGGMETKYADIRPVLKEGLCLSTIGVLLTTVFTGLFIFLLGKTPLMSTEMPVILCFLLAAAMSSTDSATVFNILRNNKMRLKYNLQPILELESGSNDPMAYVLTVILIQCAGDILGADAAEGVRALPIAANALLTLVLQLGIGALAGYWLGRGTSWLVNRIKLNGSSLYAIFILSVSFFIYSVTGLLHGNGFMAIYIAGLVIGNGKIPYKKEIVRFSDTVTWLMQMAMFLTLGLLVNPKEMLHVAPLALLIGIFLILLGRPLAVFATLLPFRKLPFRAKAFASWVGLKGAAPIIFAILPVVAGLPGSNQIFNIVFFITMVSMLVQGMTIPYAARKLHLDLPPEKETETFGIEIPEEAGRLMDHVLTEGDMAMGDTLKSIPLPEGSRVVMIRRGEDLIVPDGSVKLRTGDKLLMIMGKSFEE